MFRNKIVVFIIALALLLASCAGPAATTAPTAVTAPTEVQATPVPEQPTAVSGEPTATTEAVQPTEAPTTEATQPQATLPPVSGNVATFIFTQEFDNLNPLYTNMWFSTNTFQLWNCYAWNFDDQNNPVPVLIKEMPSIDNGEISTDSKIITLKLRDDLVWSDGQPLNAQDFLFTYKMANDPKNTVASVYPFDQFTVEAPDDLTVVMTFKEPFAPWLGSLWKGILPAHILQPVYDSAGTLDGADWNLAPTVGCGPYNFVEWESGSFARFTANPKYWFGAPKIGEIFIRFVPDDASQVAALKAGEGDLGTFFDYSSVPELEAAGIQILKVFSGYNEGWYFNLGEKGHPALKDVNVRKAIAMAFDRFSLDKDLLLGLTVPAATYWDNTPYNDPSLQPYPFDPEQAKQLLDQAGWVDSNGDGTRDKDGKELVLKYGTTTREVRTNTQAVAQQQLAEVGIGTDLLNYDSDIFFGGYGDGGPAATGELDMFEYSTSSEFPDPNTAEWLCSEIPSADNPQGTNWMAYCDQTLDGLFKKQASEVDFAARQQTFYQITKYIFDNALWIGLWQDPDLWGISGRLSNVKISGATPFYNISEWVLTP